MPAGRLCLSLATYSRRTTAAALSRRPCPSPQCGKERAGREAAAITVLTILVITDLTTGTGRFNLVRGFIGTLIAIAASISTAVTGFMFEGLDRWEGFLILGVASATATALF